MIITEEKYNEELTRCVLPFIRLNFEDGYMKSADGTRIHYGYVTTPVAKAAIVISHGFTECMPKYYEMIYYFAKAGYSVFYDNENRLFDRFVRVFVLRLPSGEVQRRQKLGERSLAGYVIKIARRYRTG